MQGLVSRPLCAGRTVPGKRGSNRRCFVIKAGIQPGVDLVQGGKVRLVRHPELKSLVAEEGYQILDTRPDYEYERAQVKGALHVPYYCPDDAMDPLTLFRKSMHAGFGGVWMGTPLTKINEEFLQQAAQALEGRKGTGVIVTCSQGLRSLVTIQDLYDDGYTNLAWLYGGLSLAGDTVESEGGMTLAEANTGGVAKIILDTLQNITQKEE